jgi:GNAT superfamily N-acetyltransferase
VRPPGGSPSRSDPLERVTERNLAELLPLLQGYCRFNGVDRGDGELLAVCRALIADPAREGVQFLARDGGGRPVGFASLFWTWATWATGRIGILGDLYVVEHARRQGIGEALIQACCADCRARAVRAA